MNAKIIYGTAWKNERTTALVVSAVLSGFRAVDTACQPKHYREDLVGSALQILYNEHGFQRESLYIQTKFTPIDGQDQTKPLPYDPSTSIPEQISSSFSTSLTNLRTTYLDSYLLHSPLSPLKLTVAAWQELIKLQEEGKVKQIGLSNVYDSAILEALEEATGKRVQVVQNRWFERNSWDQAVCKYCREKGIQYQSFWTLSGSPRLLKHPSLLALAEKKGCTPAQALFRFAQSQGITPLSGTTNPIHMQEDVDVERIDLGPDGQSTEMEALKKLVFG